MSKENKLRLPTNTEEIQLRFTAYWRVSLSKRDFPGGTPEALKEYENTFWRFMNSNPIAEPYTPISELKKTEMQ